MKTALLITTNEEFQEIEFFNELEYYYEHIGCDMIQIVIPYALQEASGKCEDLIMIVDEEGLLKADPKLNIYASAFYGSPVYGNVMIVKDAGEDFDGMEREDHEQLSLAIRILLSDLAQRYKN